MMKTFVASVRDKKSREIKIIERDYERKSDFYNDLRGNGYSVRFITTPDKFDEACEKWYEACEMSKAIHKAQYAADKKSAERRGMTVVEYRAEIKSYN